MLTQHSSKKGVVRESILNIISLCSDLCVRVVHGVYKRGTIDVSVGRSRVLAVAAYVNFNSSSFVYTYLASRPHRFFLFVGGRAAVLSQHTFTARSYKNGQVRGVRPPLASVNIY